MSTYQTLTNAIVDLLNGITDIGKVHSYQRFQSTQSQYLDQFRTTIDDVDEIRGWTVTLDGNATISTNRITYGMVERTYAYEIFGVMSLRDEEQTEATFLDLVEAILDAIEGSVDLGLGQQDTGEAHVLSVSAAGVRIYDLRVFGNTLCHYCEITCAITVDRTIA
jgi:hypothetical protein